MMAFRRIEKTGYPGSGKSTFADYRIFTETGDGHAKRK